MKKGGNPRNSFRGGGQIRGFYPVIGNDEKRGKAVTFLQKHGIIEERFYALCPICSDERLSDPLNNDEKESIDHALAGLADGRAEILDRYLEYYCDECDTGVDLDTLKTIEYDGVYIMLQERDTSLDKA